MSSNLTSELLSWYDNMGRDLPWRVKGGKTANPYRVWLSEIMLQQTTVATVKTYFERFIHLWPTIADLAEAPLEAILKEWAGLGYYARARNLHKCAKHVMEELDGKFPETEAELLKLPGIGAYTAAAITSIAFQKPAAVVDGNIERVFARLTDDHTPLPKLKERVRTSVWPHVPKDRPGDFAQALMDLGSSVCTPKKPNCLLCPIRKHCMANEAGNAEKLPVKAPKKVKTTRRALAFWLVAEDQVLLERRAEKGLLGGMPGLPHSEWLERPALPSLQESITFAPSQSADWRILKGLATHTFTHFHLETQIVTAELNKVSSLNIKANQFWHPISDLQSVGLPTVFQKMAKIALNP